MTNDNTLTRSAEFAEGFAAGFDEATNDAWTREIARRYFELVGDPINEFDAGHQAGIRAALGIAEVAS